LDASPLGPRGEAGSKGLNNAAVVKHFWVAARLRNNLRQINLDRYFLDGGSLGSTFHHNGNKPDQLEGDMEVDESIVRVGQKLDAWWEEFSTMLDSEDRMAQGKAVLRGFEIAKEFDRLKAEGIAAITALLNHPDSGPDDERAASLIHGFEFAARLADTLHDEFSDTADGETKVVGLMDAIVKALNAISPGRARLGVLLDHSDAGVRALAGAYLIDLMPERVVPMLHEIKKHRQGLSAGLRAFIVLMGWERERKSRFNYFSG
jgi:hypothetical protein